MSIEQACELRYEISRVLAFIGPSNERFPGLKSLRDFLDEIIAEQVEHAPEPGPVPAPEIDEADIPF